MRHGKHTNVQWDMANIQMYSETWHRGTNYTCTVKPLTHTLFLWSDATRVFWLSWWIENLISNKIFCIQLFKYPISVYLPSCQPQQPCYWCQNWLKQSENPPAAESWKKEIMIQQITNEVNHHGISKTFFLQKYFT